MSTKPTPTRPVVAGASTPAAAPDIWNEKSKAHLSAAWLGLPVSQRQVARLVESGALESVKIGLRRYIADSAISAYVSRER